MHASSKTAPYGAWPSPVTADLIVRDSLRLGDVAAAAGAVYWTESRPGEHGRAALVRWSPDGTCDDVLPPTFNVRSRVHEYGGGSFFVHGDTVFFSHDGDRRLYRQAGDRTPEPISAPGPWAFADGVLDPRRRRVICVVEETADSRTRNYLATLDADRTGAPQPLVAGADFYSNPRLSPDGTRCSWLSWNHPNLPWDGTELWVARLAEDGKDMEPACIAGTADESVFQPAWSPDGQLFFASDRSGWWNLYRWDGDAVHRVTAMEAEFGMPQWVFGMSTYAFLSTSLLACAIHRGGAWDLGLVEVVSGTYTSLEMGFTDIQSVHTADGAIVAVAGSPEAAPALVRVVPATGVPGPRPAPAVLRRSSAVDLPGGCISRPRPVTFPAADGGEAHALFYPPENRGCRAPAGDRPPLRVICHGGPTSCADHVLNPRIQYWTSRGFAVLDVDYRGSTGYGRAYRRRLDGRWGIADVEDCVSAARYAAEQGWVDGERMVIAGGSAGGYTVLCALAFHDLFRAGASYYGVSDLEALARDTHKFEARYLDRLVGPYPERRDLYRSRSPLAHADGLSCPVIFFQGLEDKVVPPAQTEAMVAALAAKGVPVAYVSFEGEQHGFRQAANIQRTLEAEWYFYARVLGLPVPDDVEPMEIHNL